MCKPSPEPLFAVQIAQLGVLVVDFEPAAEAGRGLAALQRPVRQVPAPSFAWRGSVRASSLFWQERCHTLAQLRNLCGGRC